MNPYDFSALFGRPASPEEEAEWEAILAAERATEPLYKVRKERGNCHVDITAENGEYRVQHSVAGKGFWAGTAFDNTENGLIWTPFQPVYVQTQAEADALAEQILNGDYNGYDKLLNLPYPPFEI